MTTKSRYYKCSRITERTFRRLIRCFTMDLTATNCSALTSISTWSVNDIFLKIRTQLIAECQRHSPFAGEIEIDESYFGPMRIRGKRVKGPANQSNRHSAPFVAEPNAPKAASHAMSCSI